METIKLFLVGAGSSLVIYSMTIFFILSVMSTLFLYKKYHEIMNKSFSPLIKIFVDIFLIIIFLGVSFECIRQITIN